MGIKEYFLLGIVTGLVSLLMTYAVVWIATKAIQHAGGICP